MLSPTDLWNEVLRFFHWLVSGKDIIVETGKDDLNKTIDIAKGRSQQIAPELFIGQVDKSQGPPLGVFLILRRMALTGVEAGPELKALLPLMGRDRVVGRLNGQFA